MPEERFDVITLLAVLEHVETDDLVVWRDACARLLEPGGLIVATVPSPRVDEILHTLMKLHVIDGMSVHEHTASILATCLPSSMARHCR